MKKSFAIIGLGRFGLELTEALSHHSVDIIALDTSEEAVRKASEFVDRSFICDSSDEVALKEIGIQNVDHAIIAYGSNVQAIILTIIILKEMNIPKITVRSDNDFYDKVFLKLGATSLISPQKIAGTRLADKIVSDSFIDYFNLSSNYSIAQVKVSENFESVEIQKLNPRNSFDVNLLLITRGKKSFSPKANDEILANDLIFVFGTRTKIAKFVDFINNTTKK